MKYVTITSDWDDDRHTISKEELQKNFDNISKKFKQEFGVPFALNPANKTYHLEIDDENIPLKQVEQLMKSLKMEIRGREERSGKDRVIRGYCPQGELKNHIVIFMDYNKKTKSGPYIFDMEGYATDPYLNQYQTKL